MRMLMKKRWAMGWIAWAYGSSRSHLTTPFNTFSMDTKLLNLVYMSAPLTRCAVCVRWVFGVRLINFPRTWGEQRTPGAWKRHLVHPVLFVFVQQTDKFQFAANGMRTIRRWCSAGTQSHPHIRAFSSRAVCEPFSALVYIRLYIVLW